MMLASRGAVGDIERLQQAGFIFDLKIDGVRCVADVQGDVVRLTSRQGLDMTARYPEVTASLAAALHGCGHVVLDGEIAVNDDRGLPSWPLTHKRDAQQSRARWWAESMPATYYAFDILTLGDEDLRREAFTIRRQTLLGLEDLGGFKTVLHSTDGPALWEVVTTHRLEGMVAKRSTAPYRAQKRTGDWVKIKRTSTVTCLVGGFDPGEGSRAATFGALHLYLLDPEHKLVSVGKVGTGFSDRELVDVKGRLGQPPLVVEVSFLDASPDGQLRQPVFQRVRHDATALDCMTEQLIETTP